MRTKWRDWLIVALLRLILACTRPLPFDKRVIWGGAIISAIVCRIPSAKKRVFKNLNLIFPAFSAAQSREILKKVTKNFGMNLVEFYNMNEFAPLHADIIPQGDGVPMLDALIAAKKPAIFVSGHFGNWEVFRAYMASKGQPLASIYKENSNPYYEEIFLHALEHSGPAFATGVRGMAGLIRHLREGNMISLLHDQRIKGAPILDFLGHKAHTSLATAEISIKYGVPILPIYVIRENARSEFTLLIEAPLLQTDPLELAQAMNDSLAARIKTNPDQWYWFHDRFHIYK